MRLHPGLPTIDGSSRKCPAVVCQISHAYGNQLCGVHITLIEADGSAKAKGVSIAKRVSGKAAQGGVWPDTYDTTIIIAEGVENALSAERQFGIPAVAGVSAYGMRSLYVPSTIRTAIIIADHDKSGIGEKAAMETAQRLMQQGVNCVIYKPAWEGKDANDIQQLEPVNNLITINRKAKPMLDAAVYGKGVRVVPVAPFENDFIKFGTLKAADPTQPEWPRMTSYLDLLQCASLDDQIYNYSGGGKARKVALRQGDILVAQYFLALRWNTTRNAVRWFLDGLIGRGLISMRRPETPTGKVIRQGGDNSIPDVLEMPKVPMAPVIENDRFSLRKTIRANTNGYSAENNSKSGGYEIVNLPQPPAANGHKNGIQNDASTTNGYSEKNPTNSSGYETKNRGQPPEKLVGVEERVKRKGNLTAGDTEGASLVRGPVDPEWFAWMPPSTGASNLVRRAFPSFVDRMTTGQSEAVTLVSVFSRQRSSIGPVQLLNANSEGAPVQLLVVRSGNLGCRIGRVGTCKLS